VGEEVVVRSQRHDERDLRHQIDTVEAGEVVLIDVDAEPALVVAGKGDRLGPDVAIHAGEIGGRDAARVRVQIVLAAVVRVDIQVAPAVGAAEEIAVARGTVLAGIRQVADGTADPTVRDARKGGLAAIGAVAVAVGPERVAGRRTGPAAALGGTVGVVALHAAAAAVVRVRGRIDAEPAAVDLAPGADALAQ